MINYKNGKKLTVLGFGGVLTIEALFFLISLVQMFLAFRSLPRIISSFLNLTECFLYLVAALGFLLMFLSRSKLLDLVTGGLVGLAGVTPIISSVFGGVTPDYIAESLAMGHMDGVGIIMTFVFSLLGSLYLIALALRVKKRSLLLCLLFIVAFFVSNTYFYSIGGVTAMWLLLNVVQLGFCALPVWVMKTE